MGTVIPRLLVCTYMAVKRLVCPIWAQFDAETRSIPPCSFQLRLLMPIQLICSPWMQNFNDLVVSSGREHPILSFNLRDSFLSGSEATRVYKPWLWEVCRIENGTVLDHWIERLCGSDRRPRSLKSFLAPSGIEIGAVLDHCGYQYCPLNQRNNFQAFCCHRSIHSCFHWRNQQITTTPSFFCIQKGI